MSETNHLPMMTLQQTYESLARWLVRRGWRRERHWFVAPGADAHQKVTYYALDEAVMREATGAYIDVGRKARRGR
jgi:hypothetical protein